MVAPALTLNNIVISSQVLGPTPSVSAEGERVGAAAKFGAVVLQDLVVYSRRLQEEPDALWVSYARFLPDLVHRCSPETLFQGTLGKILKLESILLSFRRLHGRAIPPALLLGKLGIEQRVDVQLVAYGQGKERNRKNGVRTPRKATEDGRRAARELVRPVRGRPPSWGFPLVDIVTVLGKDLIANLWAQALRLLVPVVTEVAI